MPDDVAIEKVQVLEKLGAKVERVRPGMWKTLNRSP
jgi:cysteine synthase A